MASAIGIDVGGTKILGGIVDQTGVISHQIKRDTPVNGGAELTQSISEVAKELMEFGNSKRIGVSAAGFVSKDRKLMLATPNIQGWDSVPLADQLSELVGSHVILENDGNAAAWGEVSHGAARGHSHVVALTIGTGVGGGIVIDGQLYRGGFGIAGEFGHIRVVADGVACGCGAHGCLEQYASGSALPRYAKTFFTSGDRDSQDLLSSVDGDFDLLTGNIVTDAALRGNTLAIAAFTEIGKWLGAAISTLSVSIDPTCIVIGGGAIRAGEILLDPIRKSLKDSMPFAGKHPLPDVVGASLGNQAGLIGVADLALR